MSDRAIVVGAGISGLATAIALQRAGREVLVLERAAELWEIGAGISLWPNAVMALRRLGVGAAVEAAGAAAHDAAFRSWRGAQLGASITTRLQGRFGAPLVIVHRARLQAALRLALGPDALRLGAKCVALDQDDLGVTVRLADGGVERGAVAIAADGLRSRARGVLFDDGLPRYAGITAWRGVVPVDDTLRSRISGGESYGHGSLFGVARLNGSQAYWWASARRPKTDGQTPAMEKSSLLHAFSGWHDPIPELVEATPSDAIIRTCLYERAPLRRLSVGRIALAGDAAHPMLPNLGQGGCQAIEDAVVLADELTATDDVVAALGRYSARRARHTAAVVKASRQMSRIAHLRNPLAVGVRNTLLRASPPSMSLRRLEPIVGHVIRPAPDPSSNMNATTVGGASNQRPHAQKDRVRVVTPEDFQRKVCAHKPDNAVVDVRMPPTRTDEGLRAAAALPESRHSTAYPLEDRIADMDTFTDAVRPGANGGSAPDPTDNVRTPPKETP